MKDMDNEGNKGTYKLYVEAGVIYTPEGTMIPKYIRLSSAGEKYVIDRIYRWQRASSRRAGGCGICYFVRIRGQDARLFYEDSPDVCRWFVESREPVRVNEEAF